jgi:hypothetical protein
MLQLAGFNKTIFLHFFDIHFLEYKTDGMASLEKSIYDEARLATRFAFLLADELLVPAASYFESALCRNILSEFYCSHTTLFNGIFLVGNALNYEEFRYRKLFQYPKKSSHHALYKDLKIDICPPLRPRKNSSTKDIVVSWQNCLESGLVVPTITRQQDFQIPGDIENRWKRVPEKLNKNAFIVKHVEPLLFRGKTHPTLKNSLHSVIDKYYFLSFVNEFDSGIVKDLDYLAPGYEIPAEGFCFSYRHLQRLARSNNIIEKIWSYDVSQLLELKNDPEWISLSCEAICPFSGEINISKLKSLSFIYKNKGISLPQAAEAFVLLQNKDDQDKKGMDLYRSKWRQEIKRQKKNFKPIAQKGRAHLYDFGELSSYIWEKEAKTINAADMDYNNFIAALLQKAENIK